MSGENVEIVRRVVEATRSGEPDLTVETVVSLASPEVVFKSVLAAVEGATYEGHAGLRRYFEDLNGSWEEWRNEIHELLELRPGTVLAELEFVAKGKGSGVAIRRENAVLFVLAGGKVATVETYLTADEAREAAGRAD